MTDQIFHEELRATIRDAIASYLDTYTDEELRELATESLKPTTLAEMTDEGRIECQWMQAEVKGYESRVVIVNPYWSDGSARVMWLHTRLAEVPWKSVTPRPDLPRMEWPSAEEAEDVTPVKVGDVIESADDGFHTMQELYDYRCAYHALFANHAGTQFDAHKSWRHNDGEECFGGGWFIVTMQLPTGQVSNHYPAEKWDMFNIPEWDVAAQWDGHTPAEALYRMNRYALQEADQ